MVTERLFPILQHGNKDEQEVDRLVAGPVTYICDGCVDLCVEIVGRSDDH